MAEEIEFEVSDIRDAVQQFEQLEEAMLTAADSADRMNRTNKELVDKLDDVEGEAEDAGESAEQASSSFSGWQGTLTAFSTTATAVFEGLELGMDIISGIGEAVRTSAEAFQGWVETNSQFISQLRTQSKQTGLSLQRFQLMSETFKQLKVDQDEATDAMFTFNESVGLAAKGEKRFSEAFEELGISLKDSEGNIRDTNVLFRETLQKLGDLESQSKRSALAGELLGGDVARKLTPAFGEYSDTLEDVEERLIVVDEQTEKTIGGMNAELSLLSTNLSSANAKIFRPVAEEIEKIADETNDWFGANKDIIPEIRNLVDTGFEGFLESIGVRGKDVKSTLDSIKNSIEEIEPETAKKLGTNIGKIATETGKLASEITGIDFSNLNESLDKISNTAEDISKFIDDLSVFGDLSVGQSATITEDVILNQVTGGLLGDPGREIQLETARTRFFRKQKQIVQNLGVSRDEISDRLESSGFETTEGTIFDFLSEVSGDSRVKLSNDNDIRELRKATQELSEIMKDLRDELGNQTAGAGSDQKAIPFIIDSIQELKQQANRRNSQSLLQ